MRLVYRALPRVLATRRVLYKKNMASPPLPHPLVHGAANVALPLRVFVFVSGLQLTQKQGVQRSFCEDIAKALREQAHWDAGVCLMRLKNMTMPAPHRLHDRGRALKPADLHDAVFFPEEAGAFSPADADVVLLLPDVLWPKLRAAPSFYELLQRDSLLAELLLAVSIEIHDERGNTPLFVWALTPQVPTDMRRGTWLPAPGHAAELTTGAAGEAAAAVADLGVPDLKKRERKGEAEESISEEQASALESALRNTLERETSDQASWDHILAGVAGNAELRRAAESNLYDKDDPAKLSRRAVAHLETFLVSRAKHDMEERANGPRGRHLSAKHLVGAVAPYLRPFARANAGMVAVKAEEQALRGEQCIEGSTAAVLHYFEQQKEELKRTVQTWRAAAAVVVACQDLLADWSRHPSSETVARLCADVARNDDVKAWDASRRRTAAASHPA